MYTQIYPFFTPNMYYIPQFVAPEMQYSAYFSQLPTTYQN